MASEKGLNIQIELKKQDKTQRWLLQELHTKGFANIDASRLSRILTGAYPWGVSTAVINASNEVLGIKENTGDAEIA